MYSLLINLYGEKWKYQWQFISSKVRMHRDILQLEWRRIHLMARLLVADTCGLYYKRWGWANWETAIE